MMCGDAAAKKNPGHSVTAMMAQTSRFGSKPSLLGQSVDHALENKVRLRRELRLRKQGVHTLNFCRQPTNLPIPFLQFRNLYLPELQQLVQSCNWLRELLGINGRLDEGKFATEEKIDLLTNSNSP